MASSTPKSKKHSKSKPKTQFKSTPISSAGSTPNPSSSLPVQSPSQTAPPISHPAHTLLSRSHPAATAATIFTDKIKNKPLLLNPSHLSSGHSVVIPPGPSQLRSKTTTATTTATTADSRALRRRVREHKNRYALQKKAKRAGHRALSAKEKRQLNLYALPNAASGAVAYEIYEGLNRMWTGYVREVLGFPPSNASPSTSQYASTTKPNTSTNTNTNANVDVNTNVKAKIITPASHGSLLASLDFHGMNVEVTRSKDPGKVGLKGIIVRETQGMFVIVVKTNKSSTIDQVASETDSNRTEHGNTDENGNVPAQNRTSGYEAGKSKNEEDNKNRKGNARFVKILKRGSVFRVVVDISPSLLAATSLPPPPPSSSDSPNPSQTQIRIQNQPHLHQAETEAETQIETEAKRRRRKTLIFELYGSQLERRPADRAVKQFKWTRMEGL